jgi:class 3 adenylate cyclase
VGEIKPQFSLVGDSILLAQKLCNLCPPGKIVVTKLTHHYLELYTNNYSFQLSQVFIMGFGNEPIYYVSTMRGKMKAQQEKNAVKTFDGNLLAPQGMHDKL